MDRDIRIFGRLLVVLILATAAALMFALTRAAS
jgi:hypothetical protein